MRWGSHVAHWGMVMVIIQVRKIGVFEEENKNTETVKYRCRHFYFTERIVRLIGTWWVYQAVNRELHPKHRSMGWGTYRPLEFTDGCGGAEHAAGGDAADDAAETTWGFDEAPGELHGATRQTLSSEWLRASQSLVELWEADDFPLIPLPAWGFCHCGPAKYPCYRVLSTLAAQISLHLKHDCVNHCIPSGKLT